MLKIRNLLFVIILGLSIQSVSLAGDNEFLGAFESALMANSEDMDDIIFKPESDFSRVTFENRPAAKDTKITVARLYNPLSDKKDLIAALVEVEDKSPVVFVDSNMDRSLSKNESLGLSNEKSGNPYIWEAKINLPINNSIFKNFPIAIQYYENVKYGEEMTDDERLILQTSAAYAKGLVDIKGKKTVVIYGFSAAAQRISPSKGWLGVDGDGDGEVYLDDLSPEFAKADDEAVIFRAGQTFVSTKSVDLDKNQIILKEHKPAEYKRIELRAGEPLPDFDFVDFEGKKRKLSDYRGKYLLIDIWGLWCPPCLKEMPYLKAAYTKFQSRNFEILGLNTDPNYTPESIRDSLKKNGMNWSQAKFESIIKVLKAYRISAFPTTILLDPQGKIVSLNQTNKGQPSLRSEKLLKSLEKILPQ